MKTTFTAFHNEVLLTTGTLKAAATAVMAAINHGSHASFYVFDDNTGRTVELDLRGNLAEVLARLPVPPGNAPADAQGDAPADAEIDNDGTAPRGRGRPKLGVIAREVTLLPRHWEWLATQPGGASVAIRRLVETARRTHAQKDQQRAAHERAYHVMATLAGNNIGFEEASRALFADDQLRFEAHTRSWQAGLRSYLMRLGFMTPAE